MAAVATTMMAAISRRTAAVAALAGLGALAGCLSTPAYAPPAAVEYTEDAGGGAAIRGPGFALQFAAAGFHLPEALTIDGVDVLGHAASPACFAEDEAGFLISPTPRISATGTAVPVTNRLVPVLRGPAVAQVTLEWATRFTCNPARAPSGTSTFTAFPDGRIVRHDLLRDTSGAEISSGECACDEGPEADGFTVSSFWTFARAPFTRLHAPDPEPLPAPGETATPNLAAACLEAGSYQVALAWRDAIGVNIRGHEALVGISREMVYRASKLDPFAWDASSAVLIDRAGCAEAGKRAAEHAEPSELRINGAVALPSAVDGIYGSSAGASTDGPALVLEADRAELTGSINGSFAVWLRFPRPIAGLRATLDRATGAWYLPQQVDDRTWVVWFRDSLAAAQRILIEPR